MADEMDIVEAEPRGTKRTANEAGLPEAPRRIRVSSYILSIREGFTHG